MLVMQKLRECGSMWMRDNMAPPTSPILTWPGSRDQLWWQEKKKRGLGTRLYRRTLEHDSGQRSVFTRVQVDHKLAAA